MLQRVQIRKACKEDIPHILRLWTEMWQYHAGCDPKNFRLTPSAEITMEGWFESRLEDERVQVLVAYTEGEIIGYSVALILENPPTVPDHLYGLIDQIGVTERARLQGVGKMMVEYIHRWMKAKGINYVDVHVSVYNKLSQGFWRGLGYTEFLERLRCHLSEGMFQ
jgi:ribosomal protein S18 acetylase RimI-like enzyme